MQKMLVVLLIVFISVIMALPFFGNKTVETILNDRIEVLNSYGLDIDNTKTDSTYLKSIKYYTVCVKDANKFITYLNQFSNSQIPIYIEAILEGTKLEVKIQYNNMPFSDEVSIAIYPVELSEKVLTKIKENDVEFSKYFSEFLSNRGFAYYLNYNILSEDFDGYIKNIDESYTFSSGYKVEFKLLGTAFKGNGLLVAPKKLNSKVNEVFFSVNKDSEKLEVILLDISESLIFKSKTNYNINSNISNITLKAIAKDYNDTEIVFDNINIDFSTNIIDNKINFYTKVAFDKLFLSTKKAIIDFENFIYDTNLTKVDKESFELILDLLDQSKTDKTPQIQKQITENIIMLLSKGIELKVNDISLDKVILNKTQNLQGMSLKADFVLAPNNTLINKQTDPITFVDEMNLNILLKISKKMFNELSKSQPVLAIIQSFAKEQESNLIFDIKIKDTKLIVNDKVIE